MKTRAKNMFQIIFLTSSTEAKMDSAPSQNVNFTEGPDKEGDPCPTPLAIVLP